MSFKTKCFEPQRKECHIIFAYFCVTIEKNMLLSNYNVKNTTLKMKRKILTVVALMTIIMTYTVSGCVQAGESAKNSDAASSKKFLTVYFSRTGNTRAIADHIHSVVGGDIFEIETTIPYPESYDECVDQAKQEKASNARPALKERPDSLGAYDVIFVGFPIWWGTFPMAVATFLEGYDLSGKTVIPFCTHAGSGKAQSFSDVEKLTPGSDRSEGFVTWGNNAKDAGPEIRKWLHDIQMAQ